MSEPGVITWNNGDEQTFDGKDAKAIAQTVKKLHKLNIEPALP